MKHSCFTSYIELLAFSTGTF